MSDFDAAFDYICENEGGFVNDKFDKGGATKFGITINFLTDEKIDIDLDGDTDIDDIKKLDKEKAKKIYKKYFWDKYNYSKINNLQLAIKIFDFCINAGPSAANKMTQQVANQINASLLCDGNLGQKSIETINKLIMNDRGTSFIQRFVIAQENFYLNLVKNNPTQKRFIDGWLARAKKLPK